MASSVESPWRMPTLEPTAPAPVAPRTGALLLPDLLAGSARVVAAPTQLEEARERGYAEGVADGAVSAQSALDPVVAALTAVVTHIDGAQLQFARDRERNLEALAIAIARKLVQREVTADPGLLAGMVARATQMLSDEPRVRVRLHPADLDLLGDRLEVLVIAGRSPVVQWTADPILERGSFVAESPRRFVDGRLDVALRELYERFDS